MSVTDADQESPPARPPLPSQIAPRLRPPAPTPATDGAPVEGAPVPGAAVDGAPVDGAPVDGAPVDGAPVGPVAVETELTPVPVAPAPPAETAAGDAASTPDAAQPATEGAATDPWGRVADDGTVYVTTADGERTVGSWQVGEPAQALTYYRRKYDALVVEVDLLERRVRAGALPPDEAMTSLAHTREHVQGAQVVGDLAALTDRLDALVGVIEARRAKRKAERARALEAARRKKEALVADAEAIGAGSDWHDGADRLRAMLDQWKALPRLEKRADDELWHRFSAARTTYTRRRKSHFAELAGKRDDAKAVKERLVAEAEELSSSTEWGPTAARYRALMSEWKAAGPAPRKEEETLWQRFRAAQDAFFTARTSTLSARDSAEKLALEVKESLLAEAEALLPVTDLAAAKAALRSIQDRWFAAGRVPRDAVTRVEGRLRKVEEAVRAGEQAEWTRTSPEALARAEATVAQLQTSIAKLEKQLAAAEAGGNARAAADATAALETRRSWLAEAERTLADFKR